MEFESFFRFGWYVGVVIAANSTVAVGETPHDGTLATSPLAEAVASFGAVTHDGWLYVYSGHIGTAHEHSKDNLSQHFRRRPVQGGNWEQLPMETPLQGLALVADDGLVYRIGGMTAKNTADEEADLISTDTFARFDPKAKRWTHLTPLPEGRSSHDAVVIDGKIYVVGGWKLSGVGQEGEWHTETLVFDLTDPQQGWRKLPQPFERRALATAHYQGKLYVIGGMNSSHEIDRLVDIYDPASSSWSKGPQFPGEGMNGFGASAWNNGHALLASGSNGVLYRLSVDGTKWIEAARLSEPRFFHRLVSAGDRDILVIGGASKKGHLTKVERISLDQ